MNQIQIWQLVVDLGLVASVLAMTARAFKSSQIPSMLPQTRELEASLRALIGDAERAGQHLNDQLLHRERTIQSNLTSIQETEARMTKILADAEVLHQKLQATKAETIRVVQDLRSGLEQGIQSEQGRVAQPAPPRREPPAAPIEQPKVPETDTTFTRSTYGEGVSPARQRALAAAEREQKSPPDKGESAIGQDLRSVYAAAETMIKQGAAIEQVARQTKIPVEGVRLLAEMIEVEREEDSRKQDPLAKVATTDSRLGALGGIRRQTTVL